MRPRANRIGICVLTGSRDIPKRAVHFSSKNNRQERVTCFPRMNKLIRAAGMLSLGAASLAVSNSARAAEGDGKPWKIATAVASSILGVNPFDQPDVETSKVRAPA